MYQYEKRLNCRGLGKEIKYRRKAKNWTWKHLARLAYFTSRFIMDGAAEGIRKIRETGA